MNTENQITAIDDTVRRNAIVILWSKGLSQFASVQEEFERLVGNLVNLQLRKADDYALEKFIKSCVDQVRPIEKLMMFQYGVDHSQIAKIRTPAELKAVSNKMKVIEKTMLGIVRRMHRHSLIFLQAVKR
ncbi:hypothetical protein ACOBQJ_03595 [Pelotomaculum propionicicum]|uniref:hypothetical protein n=1 Tax=Pelotomaculum propionicicum TaxID=258475 RepID=UPI003B823E9F